MNLHSKVAQLNRIGHKVAAQLKRLGIETVENLLFYFPFRYEDYSQVLAIKDLTVGERVSVLAKIEQIQSRRNFRTRRLMIEAYASDNTGRLRLLWFGQPFIAKILKSGDLVYLSGKVARDKFGFNLVSPIYEKIKIGTATTHTARIVPMYPLTAGLSQKQIRFLVSQVIYLSAQVADWLPSDLRERADVMELAETIKLIHFPENYNDIKSARERLGFDELFILQLRAEMIRQSLKRQTAPRVKFEPETVKKFLRKLEFKLTDAQKIATWEILRDMDKSEPMNRLLQGDVGAGKTVVAAICADSAVASGLQTIIMAPTEVLAFQHYESFRKFFGDGADKICLYTRSQAQILGDKNIAHIQTLKRKKEYISQNIKAGKIKIAIGTHALLAEKVIFQDLGLVVVDEQQRFGVAQRKLIKDKSGHAETMPHFLSMTATPIPRSLALALYGDLYVSRIKGLPPGRQPIKTRLVDSKNRNQAYKFIADQVQVGRQVFVICPLIEITDGGEKFLDKSKLEKKSVMSEYKKLKDSVFPGLRIGYLHGKLKPKEKEATMREMAQGKLDILISTSVIEVGVDIPNASVMMIEGADRFGLAQLHQFRGRVGRSTHQSYCFLFTENESDKSQQRLNFFEKNTDGFKLAEFDLATRGPGEVYGRQQSGLSNFRFVDFKNSKIIKTARELALGINFEKYPGLKEKIKAWESEVHLE